MVGGLLLAIVLAARAPGGGLLLNWDLVVGPDIPFPPGFLGAGPELPRRVPFYGPLALLSQLVGGPTVVAIVVAGAAVGATVGMARLAGWGRVGAVCGLAFAASPLVTTRMVVGHLPLVVAMALVPWLLADRTVDRRILPWGLVFSLTGSSGAPIGILPLALVAIGRPTWRRRLSGMTALAVSQAAWVVPGLVVWAGGVALPAAATEAFRTRIDGGAGVVRLLVGGGFFLPGEDMARSAGWPAVVLALLVLHLAVLGWRTAPPPSWWTRSALLGALLVVVPAVPGVGAGWERIVAGPLLVVRETQKFWVLPFVVVLTAVARALRREEGRWRTYALAAGVVAAAWPALLGAGGRLVERAEPSDLAAVRGWLADEDRVVVAFPWQRYGPSALADGRTVLEPAPWLVDGTVLASSRSFGSIDSAERRTDDEARLAAIDVAVRAGRDVAPDLRHLGVDAVVVLGSPDAPLYRRIGAEDGVEVVVDGSGGTGSGILAFDLGGTGGRTDGGEASAPIALVGLLPGGAWLLWCGGRRLVTLRGGHRLQCR